MVWLMHQMPYYINHIIAKMIWFGVVCLPQCDHCEPLPETNKQKYHL